VRGKEEGRVGEESQEKLPPLKVSNSSLHRTGKGKPPTTFRK